MKEFKIRILDLIEKAEEEIDFAGSRIEEVKELLKINNEVEDFIGELMDNESLPQEIRDRATELWKQI